MQNPVKNAYGQIGSYESKKKGRIGLNEIIKGSGRKIKGRLRVECQHQDPRSSIIFF